MTPTLGKGQHRPPTDRVQLLAVEPKYLRSLPETVSARIKASRVFTKVHLTFSPPNVPVAQGINSGAVKASQVSNEMNTLLILIEMASLKEPIAYGPASQRNSSARGRLGPRQSAMI